MLTKGHDFQHVTQVVVLNVDAQLVSHDFRASERLYATLTQVIGRAGRGGQASDVWIETRFPAHALYGALLRANFADFADGLLTERAAAQLPPAVFHVLLTAESRVMQAALDLLRDVRDGALQDAAPQVRVYDPVPMTLAKRADVYRAQLLLEASHRQALHRALDEIAPGITVGRRPAVRLRIEVDPLEI